MALKLHNSIPKDPYTKQLCERDHRFEVGDGSPLLESSCLELLIGDERLDDFTFPSFKGTSWSSLPLLAGLVNFRLRHFRIGTP